MEANQTKNFILGEPMSDSEFLTWLSARLVNTYGAHKHVDYVLRVQKIADKLHAMETQADDFTWDLNND